MRKLLLPLLLASTAVIADPVADLSCMALNVYHEARNQGDEGMLMVMSVTKNRVASDAYPDSICDVVYQPYQFSWVYENPSLAMAKFDEIFDFVVRHIDDADIADGSLWYHNHHIVHPAWADKLQVVAVVNDHTFYKK